MEKVVGYLELAKLNWELTEAYLKEAEDQLAIARSKLEAVLKQNLQYDQDNPFGIG
jgi:exonuclease VII small subunit